MIVLLPSTCSRTRILQPVEFCLCVRTPAPQSLWVSVANTCSHPARTAKIFPGASLKLLPNLIFAIPNFHPSACGKSAIPARICPLKLKYIPILTRTSPMNFSTWRRVVEVPTKVSFTRKLPHFLIPLSSSHFLMRNFAQLELRPARRITLQLLLVEPARNSH